MSAKKYHGSCHCGKVTFEADIDLAAGSGKCNCNYCTKIRSWKVFVKPDAFKLVSGTDEVTGYAGHNPTTTRYFCKTCGVHTHEIGDAEWMGGPFAGVFLGALNDASIDELMSGPVSYSDGRNNDWMNSPADTRNL
jgi:hypothetical protein